MGVKINGVPAKQPPPASVQSVAGVVPAAKADGVFAAGPVAIAAAKAGAAATIAKVEQTAKAILKVNGKSELDGIIAEVNKKCGPKTVVAARNIPNPERLPTGIFEFDLAIGGGWPCSRYSILYGPESSGKTNVVYKTIAMTQRRPGPCNRCVFVDIEGTFDPLWAVRFGVDIDLLLVAKPAYGEQAVDMIDALVGASDLKFLAVDSIAVLVAAKELEGSTEKADVGTSALLVKRLANKMAIRLSEEQKRDHTPAVVFINQTRFKIGVMFGDPETMPGGQTVKFNASLIVRVYGKNLMVKEISSDIPAFKHTTASIKKAKVGVCKAAFEYDIAMMEHDGLAVGDTDSFGQVKSHLQAKDKLVKGQKGGWDFMPGTSEFMNFKTLEVMRDTYMAEPDFMLRCQQLVISDHEMVLVEAQNLNTPAPEEAADLAPVQVGNLYANLPQANG